MWWLRCLTVKQVIQIQLLVKSLNFLKILFCWIRWELWKNRNICNMSHCKVTAYIINNIEGKYCKPTQLDSWLLCPDISCTWIYSIILPAGISSYPWGLQFGWTGAGPVFYSSFDYLNGLVLMERDTVAKFPLIQGKVILRPFVWATVGHWQRPSASKELTVYMQLSISRQPG